MKKILSLILALMLLLTLGTTAFAASDDGSITITNATIGESYAVYKVFDLTYSGENVAYTYTKTGETDAFYDALVGESSPFALTAAGSAYNVALKEEKTAADITTFLNDQKANLAAKNVGEAVVAESDTVKFDNLPYGYYYITSTLGGTVTIDSTLKDVEVVDKNQKPDWDNGDDKPGKVIVNADGSKVTENSVNYGDIVSFSIAVNATAYVGDKQVTYYYITDTLAEGFSEAQDIEVYVNGNKLGADAYTLTQNGNTFQVTLPYAASYGANSVIEVKYNATVLNSALLAGDGNLNKANFTYDTKTPGDPTPDPEPDPSFPSENEKTTKTYVYALGIVKVDPKGNVLKGAEFSVADANGNDIYAKAAATPGVYEYCSAETEGAAKQFKTDDNGVLVIKGVAAGTYSVTEVVAPAGYNVLKDAKDVQAVLKEQYTTTITTYLDADGNVTNQTTENTKDYEAAANVVGLVVVNQSGTELPSTGGIGTTIFYVLGGLLMAGAAVLLITKKRMSAKG